MNVFTPNLALSHFITSLLDSFLLFCFFWRQSNCALLNIDDPTVTVYLKFLSCSALAILIDF